MGSAEGSDSGPVEEIIIPYCPRDIWIPFHRSDARFRVVVAHRRAGKTVAAINECIRATITCPLPNPRFGYIAPLLGQAKSVAWDYVRLYAGAIPGVKFNEAELRADFPNGGRFRLFGADNFDALRGQYFDGVVPDEFGNMDPRAWTEVIRPALSDRKGWAVFLGTPNGKNTFYDLRNRAAGEEPDWELFEFKASASGILPQTELDAAKTDMTPAAYEREYECSFDATIEGAYYAKEMTDAAAQGRICSVPVDPIPAVDTAWDLGIDDATSIWFIQDVGRERRLIDYLEVSGEGLPQIMARLDAKGYRYGRHMLPHDVEVRELGNGTSRRETLEKLGLRDIEVIPAQGVADGINAVRLMLSRCWFDAKRCERGIEALKQYRREFDGKRQTWRERPLHDWTSHAADAFRYLALASAKPEAKAWSQPSVRWVV